MSTKMLVERTSDHQSAAYKYRTSELLGAYFQGIDRKKSSGMVITGANHCKCQQADGEKVVHCVGLHYDLCGNAYDVIDSTRATL